MKCLGSSELLFREQTPNVTKKRRKYGRVVYKKAYDTRRRGRIFHVQNLRPSGRRRKK